MYRPSSKRKKKKKHLKMKKSLSLSSATHEDNAVLQNTQPAKLLEEVAGGDILLSNLLSNNNYGTILNDLQ
jgi:hypothetical protein